MLNSFQSPTESHIFYLFQIYSTDEFQCLKLLFNMSLKVHVDRDRGSRTVSDKDKVKSQFIRKDIIKPFLFRENIPLVTVEISGQC